VIEARILNQIAQCAAPPRLRIGRPVDQPLDAAVHQGSRAHRARFQGAVQRALRQPPPAHPPRRLPDRQELGMRQRIAVRLAPVVAPPDDLTALPTPDHHRADRHLADRRRPLRLRERLAHPDDIRGGLQQAPYTTRKRRAGKPAGRAAEYSARRGPLLHQPQGIAWGSAAAAHEGFGSCASVVTEPRQARKGAAIRYPAECRSHTGTLRGPLPPLAPQTTAYDLPGSRPQVAPPELFESRRPGGHRHGPAQRPDRGTHRPSLSLLRHPRRRQDDRRPRPRQGAQLRARTGRGPVQRVLRLHRHHPRLGSRRHRGGRSHLLEGRAGARADREPQVRAVPPPLQGGGARRDPPPVAAGLRRAPEDRRGAAAAPAVHLRHHGDRRGACDDPVALPGVPLPPRAVAGPRRSPAYDLAEREHHCQRHGAAADRPRRRGERARLRRPPRPARHLRLGDDRRRGRDPPARRSRHRALPYAPRSDPAR